MIAEELSVCDAVVHSYTVDYGGHIRLSTATYSHGASPTPEQYTDVTFTGVLAYHFVGEMGGASLHSIAEVTPVRVYEAFEHVFTRKQGQAWPFTLGDTETAPRQVVTSALEGAGVRAFVIRAYFGMDGFVLAKAMEIESRPAARAEGQQ